MQNILSLILGGGRGTRLFPLTQRRSKPAVPIAGKYRLIDIPVSNCLNSGLNRIYVLTQFLSASLHRHIANTYKFDMFSKGFVEVLAAQQTMERTDWYQGTADAVRQNLRFIEEDGCQEVLILSGDQIYRMDFRQLVQTHHDNQADVTIAVLPVSRADVAGFGIVRVDDSGRVIGFVEKPKTEEQLKPVHTPADWLAKRGLTDANRPYLASMGIYLFKRKPLFDLLNAQPPATDFGKEIFPRSIPTHRVQAHLFDGYWEDVGTIKAYHDASLILAGDNPPFDFYSPEGVIYTHMRNLPASRICAACVDHCLVSDGCLVEAGTRLERSIIGVRSQIGRNVTIRNTVLMGADYFEGHRNRLERPQGDSPPIGIGDDSVLDGVIADKNCRIGRGVRIVNPGNLKDMDGDNYVVRDGVVVIPNGAVLRDGTVL